jgi:hypothetical protein
MRLQWTQITKNTPRHIPTSPTTPDASSSLPTLIPHTPLEVPSSPVSFNERALLSLELLLKLVFLAIVPGSGSMSAPLRFSTKKTPTIIGKPHTHMMETILAAYVVSSALYLDVSWLVAETRSVEFLFRISHNFNPERTIMIGDNLETDILFGINSNITTLLVMTGEQIPLLLSQNCCTDTA